MSPMQFRSLVSRAVLGPVLAAWLGLLAPATPAQQLPTNATKEQIADVMGIRKGVPPQELSYLLCFSDEDARKFRFVRLEKVVNFFAALEDAGVALDEAFAATPCDLNGRRPLAHVFSFASSPFTQLQQVMVPALATHAARTGKPDEWLLRILLLKDAEGRALYTERESAARRMLEEVPQRERAFRQLLSTFSTHETTLFGRDGSDLDVDYFRSAYRIADVENFLGACVPTFLDTRHRANWVERARMHARGEFEPRGMGQGLDLAAIQQCMKVPDMEAKMREAGPAFERREQLRYLKRQAQSSLAVMKEVRDARAQLCPPSVAAVARVPYCAARYEEAYEKLRLMVDNRQSGLTLAELDKLQ